MNAETEAANLLENLSMMSDESKENAKPPREAAAATDGDAVNAEDEVETIELDPKSKDVDLTRRRIKKIEGFEFLSQVETLCLRWNLISKIENLASLTRLTELDLYDNQVSFQSQGFYISIFTLCFNQLITS